LVLQPPDGCLIIHLGSRFYPPLLLLRIIVLGEGENAFCRLSVPHARTLLPHHRSFRRNSSPGQHWKTSCRSSTPPQKARTLFVADDLDRFAPCSISTWAHQALCSRKRYTTSERTTHVQSDPNVHAAGPPVDQPSLDVRLPWRSVDAEAASLPA
jgi:hypothetical protein